MSNREIEEIKENCAERRVEVVQKFNALHSQLLIAVAVVGGLLWGYFEWRIYPEIVEAQDDVKELRKEIYLILLEGKEVAEVERPLLLKM